MKPYFSIVILLPLLLIGAGCAENTSKDNIPPASSYTANTIRTDTSAGVLQNIPDRLTVHENLSAQLTSQPLVEITQHDITLPADYAADELEGAAVRYYRAGTDTYFALVQTGGSMSLRPADRTTTINTGVWYATSQTGGHWKSYLEITNPGSVQNNPFHFWSDKNTLNLLTIDYHGAGSGEGIAKILTSEDGGSVWFTSECFYFTAENFSELFDKDPAIRKDFVIGLKKKRNFATYNIFKYNQKTGHYEGMQRNKAGNTETIVEDSCANIIPNNQALSAAEFEAQSTFTTDQKSATLTIEISPSLPPYHLVFTSRTTTTSAAIKIFRANLLWQTIPFPTLPREYVWRSEDVPHMFVMRDVNFDGYTDIGVTVDGGAKWGSEQYWIFNPNSGGFDATPLTNDLRKIAHNEIRFDTSTEHIITNNFIGAGLYKKTTYAIRNGRLKMIEDYEQEPVYKNDQPTGECTETLKKEVNGTLKTTTETLNEECSGFAQI